MTPPVVRDVVQGMMATTRVEGDFLIEKNVVCGDGRQGELYGLDKRKCNQLRMDTTCILIYSLRWTLQRRGESLRTTSDDDEDP